MTKKRKPNSGNPAKQEKEETAVWIKTEPTLDGQGWMVTVEVNEDTALTLDRESASGYAYAVLGAVAHAEYDAGVLRQMSERIDERSGMQLVIDLRKDRAPLDQTALGPMRLVPGVTAQHKPFLTLEINGDPVGQWTIPDARTHALNVLEAIIVADLDGDYLRCLRGVVGLEEPVARNIVDDLQNWRD